MNVCGLIPAAGLSSRMGRFKPLLPLGGRSLIEGAIDPLLQAGASRVVVVTGFRREELEEALRRRYPEEQVLFAHNPAFARTDMLASVKAGLKVMPPCQAFFLLPGDMPLVRPETCLALCRAMEETKAKVVFPLLAGGRGHPPLISDSLRQEILRFDGEGGLRAFWKLWEGSICAVPVDDDGCGIDLDTYQQYSAITGRKGGPEAQYQSWEGS